MEAVEDVSLLEELALGRVDVLPAQRIVVAQPPGLESDDPAARVREREHQPEREVVVAPLVRRDPRRGSLRSRTPAPAPLRQAPSRGTARGGTPARRPHRDRAPRGTRGPAPGVRSPRGCRSKYAAAWSSSVVDPLAAPAGLVLPRRGLLVLERHAEALGEPLDRADEVDVLGLPHELDDVAAAPAAEAVVELADGSTEKLGVRSSWNGQRPVKRAPEPRRSDVRADTTSTMSAAPLDLRDARVLDPRHVPTRTERAAYASAKRSVIRRGSR